MYKNFYFNNILSTAFALFIFVLFTAFEIAAAEGQSCNEAASLLNDQDCPSSETPIVTREVSSRIPGSEDMPPSAASPATTSIQPYYIESAEPDQVDTPPPQTLGAGTVRGVVRTNPAPSPTPRREQADNPAAPAPSSGSQTTGGGSNQPAVDPQLISSRCQSLYDSCVQAATSASTECNADSSGNSSGRSGQFNINQIGQTISNAAAQSGQGGAAFCATMGRVSAVANSAIVGFTLGCSQAQSSCTSSCTDLLTLISRNECSTRDASGTPQGSVTLADAREEATRSRQQCNRLASRASDSGQSLNRAATDLLAQSQRCIDQQYSGGLAAYCAANPSVSACVNLASNDCSREPGRSSNLTCICIREPSNSQCGALAASRNARGGIESSGSGGAALSGTDGTGSAAGLNLNDGATGLSLSSTAGTGGAAAAVGGRKGMQGLQSGEGFAPGGGPAGRANAGGDISDRTKIFRGGTGGAAGGGGWGTPAAANAAATQAGGAGIYNGTRNTENVDLRQFLPGGAQDPNARGPSNVVGPSGITGAYGKSNFEKVSNRYMDHYFRGSFLPLNYHK